MTEETEKTTHEKPDAAKAAEGGMSVAVSRRLDAIEKRLDVVESALRLELGVDPDEHAASLERTPGGIAGDAGAE